jgi:hypothetical protein
MEYKAKEVNIDYKRRFFEVTGQFLQLNREYRELLEKFDKRERAEAEEIYEEVVNDENLKMERELRAEEQRQKEEEKQKIEDKIRENATLSEKEFSELINMCSDPYVLNIIRESYRIYKALLSYKYTGKAGFYVKNEDPDGCWKSCRNEEFAKYSFLELIKRYEFKFSEGTGEYGGMSKGAYMYSSFYLSERRYDYETFVEKTGKEDLFMFLEYTDKFRMS